MVRCSSISPAGKQCDQNAPPGKATCRRHGAQPLVLFGIVNPGGGGDPNKASIYEQNAGPHLRGVLRKLGGADPSETLSLLDEVQVARAIAARSMQVLSVAEQSTKCSEDLKIAAADHALRSVTAVGELAARAAKVRKESDITAQSEAIDWVTAQVCRIIQIELRDHDPRMADRIVERIKRIKPRGLAQASGASEADPDSIGASFL